MKERRKFVRAGIQSNIKWAKDVKGAEKEIEHRDVTRNIGGGGICITTTEKLNECDRILVEIDLPTGDRVRSRGRVAWVSKFEFKGPKPQKGYEVGIEFLDISESDRVLVEKFVFEYLQHPEKYKQKPICE